MTLEQALEMYGPIVYEDEKCVVRVKRKGKELHVAVHHKSDHGVEKLPLAYMLGTNALIYED